MAAKASPIRDYMINLGKSIKFAAKGAVKAEMPTLIDTYDSSKEAFKSGVSYTREFIAKRGGSTSQVNSMVSRFLKDLDTIKKNAFEDLKTGKIVNFERQSKALMEEMGFSDLEMDLDSSFGDEEQLESLSPIEQTMQAARMSAKANEIGSNLRTKALMEIISESSERSADYIVKNSRKLHSMSISLMAQMHTETIKTLTDTNNLLSSILEFHNNQVVDHMNKQLVFFDNVLTELREIKEALKPPVNQTQKQSQLESVFGYGGFNIKEYGKAIKKNFETWFSMTPIGMAKSMSGGGMGNMLWTEFKSSPLAMITQFMISGLMPKSLKFAMRNLDNSLAGLFSAMVFKFNSWKSDFRNPLKSMLGNIFGLEIDNKRTIDVGRFHKGPMPFNGLANKAIVEVIPTLLSNILAAIRGDSRVPIFNYETGKFTFANKIIKERQERIQRSTRSSMYNIRENLKTALGRVEGGTSDFMMKELDSFIDFLVSSDRFYNPLKEKSPESLIAGGLKLRDPRSYNVLRSAFLSLPKHIQNTLYKSIIDAKREMKKTIEYIEEELQQSGLSAAYNNLGKLLDPKGKTTFSDISSTLKDIRQILLDGIVVYQGDPKGIRGVFSRRSSLLKKAGVKTAVTKPAVTTSTTGLSSVEERLLSMSEAELRSQMVGVSSFNFETYSMNKFIQEVLGQTSASGKFRVIKDKIRPRNILNRALNKLDELIYRIIYGKEESSSSDGNDGEPGDSRSNSFLSRITTRLSNAIDKSVKWVDKHILTPLHEKFFGAKGLFTRAVDAIGEFADKVRKGARTGFDRVKEYLIGSKTQDGFYTGGILSDLQNTFMDYSNQIRHFFTGASYKKSDGTVVEENKETSVMGYVRKYSRSIMETIKTGLFGEKIEVDEVDPETGEVRKVTKRKGDGILSAVIEQLKLTYRWFDNLFKTKKDETPEQTESAINQWKKELKGFLPKGIAGGFLGMIASSILPGGPILGAFMGSTIAFAAHSKKFREFLFGNEAEGRQGIVPERYQKILKEVKNHLPSITAGGFLGLGASLLLPGGPLLGLTLGSAIGYAARSKQVQDFLFGQYDEQGNLIKKGVFAPEFKEKLKKVIPSMGAGGLLGMGASFLLPGGPLIGLTLGSAIGFATKSERMQELLFGKTDKDGNLITKGLISPELREKIKKHLPKGIAGAVFGALSGTFGVLMPGGPLLGAIIGSALSILSTTDRFKNFLFGKEDPDGIRRGGLLGSIRDFIRDEFVDPFRRWTSEKAQAVSRWFENSVRTPLLAAVEPLKKAFGIIGDNIKKSWTELKDSFKKAFFDTFNKNVGIPLREFITKNITDPLKRMLDRFFTAIGKGIGMILTAPIKGLTLFANAIIEDHEKKAGKGTGTSSGQGTGSGTGISQDQNNIINQVKQLTGTSEDKKSESFMDKVKKNANKFGFLQFFADDTNVKDPKKRKLAGFYSPFTGTLDLEKFYAHIQSIDSNIKVIRDEVYGQLDGVGHNIETIKNILLDAFGGGDGVEGLVMGKRRGNRRRRGLFGYIREFIRRPFEFVGTLVKNLVLKPFTSAFRFITKNLIEIPKIVGKTVIRAARIPFRILGGMFKVMRGIGEGIIKFFKSDLVKKIGQLTSTVIDLTLIKPLKGLGTVIGETAKGIGVVLKDTISGLYTLSKKAIPTLITGIGKLTKGIFNLGVAIGDAILSFGKFAFRMTSRVIKGVGRGVGRLFGLGKPKVITAPSGLSGSPVYIVGGTIDQVHEVNKIVECVRVSQCDPNEIPVDATGRKSYKTSSAKKDTMKSTKTTTATKTETKTESDPTGKKSTFGKFTPRAKFIGTFLSRMLSVRWSDSVPRINIIDRIVRDVKTEDQYHSATLSLLHELTVTNIQLLDVVKDQNKDKSLWDTLKDLFNFLKNFKLPDIRIPNMRIPYLFGPRGGRGGGGGRRGGGSGGGGARGPTTIVLPPTGNTPKLPPGPVYPPPGLPPISYPSGRPPIFLPPSTGPLALPDSRGGGGRRVNFPTGEYYEVILEDGTTVYTPVNKKIPVKPVEAQKSKGIFGRVKDTASNLWGRLTGKPKIGTGPYGDYIDIGKNYKVYDQGKGLLARKIPKLPRGIRLPRGLAGRIPYIGGLLSLASMAPDIMTLRSEDMPEEYKNEAKKNIAGAAGGTLGGILGGIGAGALIGAAGGSVTGPGALITATIGAIAGGFLGEAGVRALYDKINLKDVGSRIRNWSMDKVENVKDVFSNGKEFIQEKVGAIWNSAPVETIRNVSTGLVNATGNLLSVVGYGFKEIGGAVKDRLVDFSGTVKEKFNDWVVTPAQKALGSIKVGFNAAGEWISNKWNDWVVKPVGNFTGMIKDGFNSAIDLVGPAWNEYVSKPLGNFFGSIGKYLGKSTEWISEKVKDVKEKAKEYAEKAGDWISDKWNSLWKDRGRTFRKNIEESSQRAEDRGKSVIDRIANWIRGGPKDVGGGDPAYSNVADRSFNYVFQNKGSTMTPADIEMIKEIAAKYGVNPHLWLALVETESNFNSNAVSSSNARGWGQIMPQTGKWLYENKLKLGTYNHNLAFDKRINAEMSISYLADLMARYGVNKGIMAYNVGPGTIESGRTTYGREDGNRYLSLVAKNLYENTGLTLDKVGGSPVPFTSSSGSSAAASSSSAYTDGGYDMFKYLADQGAQIENIIKQKYGDVDQLTSTLTTTLMKQIDPYYREPSTSTSSSTSDNYTPAAQNYTDAQIQAIADSIKRKYPMLSGKVIMHDFLAQRLNNIAMAYGKPLVINSGWRSDLEQQRLINEWRKSHPGASEAERRKYVADPGRSNHGIGMAADISGWIKNLSPAELERFGLWRPLPHEDWHFEPIETKILGDRSRSFLEKRFGDPFNPNPNLVNYLDPRFRSSYTPGAIVPYNTSFKTYSDNSIYMPDTGGGDPAFAGVPDSSEYVDRINNVINYNKSINNRDQKIIELLTIIAKTLEKIADQNDKTNELLQTYMESMKNFATSANAATPPVAIINQNSGRSANPFTDPARNTRGNKSAIIATIAKGTKV